MLEETGISERTIKTAEYLEITHLTVIKNTELLRQDSKSRTIWVHLPNIHTSLAEVNRRKLIDSGAIHLIGNFPLEAKKEGKTRQAVIPTAVLKQLCFLREIIDRQNPTPVNNYQICTRDLCATWPVLLAILEREGNSVLQKYTDWLSPF